VTFRPKPGTFFEPRVAVYEQVEDQPFFYVRQVGVLNKLDSARLNRAQALARNFEPVLAAEEQAPFALDDAGARLGRKLGSMQALKYASIGSAPMSTPSSCHTVERSRPVGSDFARPRLRDSRNFRLTAWRQ
jgi:hypothetical protein